MNHSIKPVQVSLTKFVDFVIASGLSRFNVVSDVFEQNTEPYSPGRDYYRAMRDWLRSIYSSKGDLGELDQFISGIADESRRFNYTVLAKGLKRFEKEWLRKRSSKWCAPAKGLWSAGNLVVRVNPELGFVVAGERHFIKLYWKDAEPTKAQTRMILHVMQRALFSVEPAASLWLLDVRRGKMTQASGVDSRLAMLLESEGAAFTHLYRQLQLAPVE